MTIYSTEMRQAFITKRAQGFSFTAIANELGVNTNTLTDWSRQYETEIKNLQAIDYDSLVKQYELCKRGRLKMVASILSKLQKELACRDFTEVPTDKLLKLTLDYKDALIAELGDGLFLQNSAFNDELRSKVEI